MNIFMDHKNLLRITVAGNEMFDTSMEDFFQNHRGEGWILFHIDTLPCGGSVLYFVKSKD